jgi:isocitrate/isopropylmalate dehydrogenase
MKTYNIASIAGDGIGKEVVPEAHKVLEKIAEKHKATPFRGNRIMHRITIH